MIKAGFGKKLLLILLLFYTFSSVFSQAEDCNTQTSKRTEKAYQEALDILRQNKSQAVDLLQKNIRTESKHTPSHFLLGIIYFENAEKECRSEKPEPNKIEDCYKSALKEFKKVIRICPAYEDYEAYYYLAHILYNQRKYEESKTHLDFYIKRTKKFIMRKDAELIRDNVNEYLRLVNNPVKFEPHYLESVNTDEYDEYLPLPSPDESLIFFTRKEKYENGDSAEIFNVSKKLSPKFRQQPEFSAGEKMPLPFNDGRNQGAASITVDNKTMYLSVCGIERGSFTSYQNCDIFTAQRLKGEWTSLKRLGNKINGSMTYESQPSISADGRTLFFSSYRDDGYGKLDLYWAHKDANGKWKPAENLGPSINTEGEEKTPFLHPDGKTLYFSGNGRFGLGGFDIYVSRYDSLTGWSIPQNIGYPINSDKDELAFAVSADGNRIYFATNKFSRKKNWDIYTTPTPRHAKPEKVLLVKGRVSGKDGDTLTHVKVLVQDINTKKETHGLVEDSTGHYAVTLPVEESHRYMLLAEKQGYIYHSEFINPNDPEYIPPSKLDIEVEKIKRGKNYILENVYFDTDSYRLSDTAKVALNTVARQMLDHSEFAYEIHGHTDNQGTSTHNYSLSYNRAKAVYDYLLELGVSKSQIEFKAFGEKRPVKSNRTGSGRSQNRRVEVLIK